MTNADGSHYTLKDLQEMKEREQPAAGAHRGVSVRDDAPYAYRPEVGAEPGKADDRQGMIGACLEELTEQHNKLAHLVHTLCTRIEPVLSSPSVDTTSEAESAQKSTCSGIREDLLRKIVAVQNLQGDVAYVLGRVEL
ncbi:hypothetical protein CH275_04955 [Rhodococcus sp. 06-235-1A]|uniref:hypothetical protein n=1 Tax=Rhodococcus sp. 06-235-1A TaxID=2022508 RepID=UPI000B9AC727|nr:hypothetical protein [Rhodococcus sp. 06-235-1A]OZD08499.1 hypothetical protein CH275_04955 [Rhodococcus sp. 06-235-1A]